MEDNDQVLWDRKLYTEGGGAARLYYIVIGEFEQPLEIQGQEYRTRGIPEQLRLALHEVKEDPSMLGWLSDGYLRRTLEENKKLHRKVIDAPHWLSLEGTIPDPPNLDYMRDTIGALTGLLDLGGVAIFDPYKLQWWAPEDWKEEVFAPDAPDLNSQVVILISEQETETEDQEPLLWLHTRGLCKFGRPDLSFRNVPPTIIDSAVELCNELIEKQIDGLQLEEGQMISSNLEDLPHGLICHNLGDSDDPDFNNKHLEVDFNI